jgi:hypothetical protein
VEEKLERFNSFTLSQNGRDFVDTSCEWYEPCWHTQGVIALLVDWIKNDELKAKNCSQLAKALMPHIPLPRNGMAILRERLETGQGSVRRRAVFTFTKTPWESWEKTAGMDSEHWNDLYAGSRLFLARDAALDVLNSVESRMTAQKPLSLAEAVMDEDTVGRIAALRGYALQFLDAYRDQHVESKIFCERCCDDDTAVLRELVRRDGHCLVLSDDGIRPGPVFLGPDRHVSREAEEEEDSSSPDAEDQAGLPEGISPRVRNARALFQEFAAGSEGKKHA